jgi:hypothetical protein
MKLFAILFFMLFTNPEIEKTDAAVEKIEFNGTVVEELTGEPIPGACVRILETSQEFYTDFDGNFSIDNFTPGTYNLEVQFVSFEKEELKNLSIDRDNNSMLIRLN